MIYVMSKCFFNELMKTCGTKLGVMAYVNSTFGLKHEVSEMRLV